jgi:hypothetical protein
VSVGDDDQHVIELAVVQLALSVRQELRGVEADDAHLVVVMTAGKIHRLLPSLLIAASAA